MQPMTAEQSAAKMAKFRAKMKSNGMDSFVFFHGDAHNNEYPEPSDYRMAFMCGFNGSYGMGVVTANKAALFTDGRYKLQAKLQLEPGWEMYDTTDPFTDNMTQYMNKMTDDVKTVAFDAHFTTNMDYTWMSENMYPSFEFCPQYTSFVDEVWGEDKIHQKFHTFDCHPMEFAGTDAKEKLERIRAEMKKEKCDSFFTGGIEDIAWTYNMRGSDLIHTPAFYAYTFITHDSAKVYVKTDCMTDAAKQAFKDYDVEVKSYFDAAGDLQKYAQNMGHHKLFLDERASYAFYNFFDSTQIKTAPSPIARFKGVKNSAEIEGMKKAHMKDAMAMCRFMCWLDKCTEDGSIFDMKETDLSDKCDYLRTELDGYKSAAFGTIAAIGEHGAMGHYNFKNREKFNLDLSVKKQMLLLDSGGQYTEGTTDVSRTKHLGEPSDYEKFCYTTVFKSHVAFDTMVFPPGTKGPSIDAVARSILWKRGMDYHHGTGHGVGAGLNVHEGPFKVDKKLFGTYVTTNLEPGCCLTNEPGTYQKENGFGIRLENTLFVKDTPTQFNHSSMQFYAFENMTFVPFETNMFDWSEMTKEETDWLNNYHQEVWEKVGKMFKEDTEKNGTDNTEVMDWLYKVTRTAGPQ